jgi:hypothetical protein
MKKINKGKILIFSIVVLTTFVSVGFCDYQIVWSTIDGGGGMSSGGQYELVGTIGQPDAGSMSSGNYELVGAFWPGGPLCFVEFEDFARFAELWLYEGEGLPADLDGNGYVDLYDLKEFIDYWLLCCPYSWPLR